MSRNFILIVIAIFHFDQIHTQSKNWQIILDNQDTLSGVSLSHLEDHFLIVIRGDEKKRVDVDHMRAVRFVRKTSFRKGFGVGLTVGFILGGFVGYVSYKKPEPQQGAIIQPLDSGPLPEAVISAIGFGLLGGMAGGLVNKMRDREQTYGMEGLASDKKILLLNTLIDGSE